MKALNPYLNFPGNTEEAFNFYKSVFGGEFSALVRFGDMKMEGCENMTDFDKTKIMHISLPLATGHVLMATDVMGHEPKPFVEGTNVTLALHADNREEGQKLYDALSKNGEAMMPFGPVEWGGQWGMLTDAYGIQWMVDCE